MEYMYICPVCGAIYKLQNNEPISCSDCKVQTIYSGYNSTDWYAMSIEKRNEVKNTITYEGKTLQNQTNAKDLLLLTTSNSFDGYKVLAYKDVIFGEVVVPNGLLGALTSGTFFTIDALSVARHQALDMLKDSAVKIKANAIVGIDIDITDLNGHGMLVSANGTAVIVSKTDSSNDKKIIRVGAYNKTDHLNILSLNVTNYEDTYEAELLVHIKNSSRISAISANIIIETLCGDRFVLENFIFTGFKGAKSSNTFISNPVSLDISDSYIDAIEFVDLDIIKYVVDDQRFIVNDHTLTDANENRYSATDSFIADNLMYALEPANNAAEISELCKKFYSINQIPMDADLTAVLDELVYTERLYGNRKKEALNAIKKHLAGPN